MKTKKLSDQTKYLSKALDEYFENLKNSSKQKALILLEIAIKDILEDSYIDEHFVYKYENDDLIVVIIDNRRMFSDISISLNKNNMLVHQLVFYEMLDFMLVNNKIKFIKNEKEK